MECKKLLAAMSLFAACAVFFGQENSRSESAPPESDDSASPRYAISAIETPGEGQNYYITKDEHDKIKFVQKLSWNEIPDIKNYRITIEKKTDDGWSEVLVKDLAENKIEVSLEAGEYRFQVAVINLFDRLEKSSAWQNFEVLKALQPKIDSMQTESMILNSKKADGVFTLEGENLTERTVFTMEKKNSEPPAILYGKILSVDSDGKSAQVQFDIEQIDEGKYEIYAQNPGGLSVISKTIHIKNKGDRQWRLLASAGYALPIEVFDGTLSRYADKRVQPISGTAKITVMAFHTKIGDFGFGAEANYSLLLADTKNYKMTGNLASALASVNYQKYFIPQRLCLDIHALAGCSGIFGTSFKNKYTGQTSPSFSGLALAFGGGLGIQYHFGKHFYAEGNVDFIYADFGGMTLGMALPSVSVGGMF